MVFEGTIIDIAQSYIAGAPMFLLIFIIFFVGFAFYKAFKPILTFLLGENLK